MNNGDLATRHRLLATRRAFLIAGAGGLAALFVLPAASAIPRVANPWPVLAAVQEHLFPAEPGAPGAREIRALAYLQGVLSDPAGDREEQDFILKGVDWLEGLCRQRHRASFVDLDPLRREGVLREVAGTEKGENWLATLLLYLCEALLCDPVYGGNPDGVGWSWLRHQPGYPRPTPDKRHGALK
ncbi:MAG: gluconate 2-dehydrogenase subunit 3 family protein [Thiobacillaceae bacterium]|jgi:gluconate 2-dehydrogenase gamma chain|nr:gluconate 2-dehydrogenase subunit 3 family protein [Thiobacillaceae bacterium]MBP9915836.1 gluconate 2-dehydrogenase subunit 3 family protein [Thiobacillaceae bacterium]